MRQSSEDDYFSSGGLSNCCPFCDAGMNNDYKHADTCLSQVVKFEGPYDQVRRAWLEGASVMLQSGRWGKDTFHSSDPRDQAHQMGARCALNALRHGSKAAHLFAEKIGAKVAVAA